MPFAKPRSRAKYAEKEKKDAERLHLLKSVVDGLREKRDKGGGSVRLMTPEETEFIRLKNRMRRRRQRERQRAIMQASQNNQQVQSQSSKSAEVRSHPGDVTRGSLCIGKTVSYSGVSDLCMGSDPDVSSEDVKPIVMNGVVIEQGPLGSQSDANSDVMSVATLNDSTDTGSSSLDRVTTAFTAHEQSGAHELRAGALYPGDPCFIQTRNCVGVDTVTPEVHSDLMSLQRLVLQAKLEQVLSEKQRIDSERNKIEIEGMKLEVEKGKVQLEMEKVKAETDLIIAEREKVQAEKEKLLSEKEKLNCEKEMIKYTTEKIILQKEKLKRELKFCH